MGQLRSVNRNVELGQDVGQGPDVVLVPVGDQDSPHPVDIASQVGDVGDDQVYPRHVLSGKLYPAIDDDDVAVAFQGHHVLANFPQASQGNDAQCRVQSTRES